MKKPNKRRKVKTISDMPFEYAEHPSEERNWPWLNKNTEEKKPDNVMRSRIVITDASGNATKNLAVSDATVIEKGHSRDLVAMQEIANIMTRLSADECERVAYWTHHKYGVKVRASGKAGEM